MTVANARHCRICRGPHSKIVHRIQKLPASQLPKGYRWGRRRNPAAMDGHTFVVIAHGKDGEVAYRGREAHLSYGAAWREAQIVARRRGLTDVHIVKDGKDIVGEVKARTNPSFGWDVVYRKRGSIGPWRYWMSSTSKIAADALASQETGRLKSREFRVIEARGEYIPTMNAPVLAHHGRNRPNPNYKPGPHSCRLCGDEIGEEEVADGQEYGYGNLCWRCDFEQHSGISHFNRDRSNGPPVFDGTWRFPRYDDKRALIAAYRRGRI